MIASESTSTSVSKSLPAQSYPRRKSHRTTILTIGLISLAGAAYLGLHTRGETAKAGAAAPPPPQVTIATVEQRAVTDLHELLGRVDAVESVEVRPRVSGHIDEVRLRAGEVVHKGDVLLVIDPRPYRAQFELARATVERARVKAQNDEKLAKRAVDLLKTKAISVEQADTTSSSYLESQAELLAAEAALAMARLNLEFTEVRAPIDGRVSRAYVTAGNLVTGDAGGATLLTSIVSVGEAYVYADVDEATLLAFNRLQQSGTLVTENGRVPVEMQLSDESDFTHRGFIESADNRLQVGTGSLVLRMIFPNPHGDLIPGLFARVRLPVSAPQKALLISERAIGTDQSQKFVLTVGADNVATYRTVKLGPLLEGQRIVREGLQPGDRVIVNGLQRSRPGALVSPQLEAPAIAAQ